MSLDEYVSCEPVPEHKDFQWSKYDKIRGLGRLKHDELTPVPVPHKNPLPLTNRLFGSSGIVDLSSKQTEQLLSKKHNPYDEFHRSLLPKDKINLEKFIVNRMNKLPEKEVGRVVRVRTLCYFEGDMVEFICLNKHRKPNRLQATVFVNASPGKAEKRQLIKDIAKQLNAAWAE